MKKINIVLAQIPEQKDLAGVERIVRLRKKADVIVFPEDTLRANTPGIKNSLREIAGKYGTTLVIGIVHESRGRSSDCAYFITGSRIECYRKAHVHWTENHLPGNKFKTVNTPFGKVGFLMCFDAAFQESGRVLALLGARLIFILSAIPADFPVEFSRLRARAMAYNNQLYVVHCSRPGRKYAGHSMIIDPQGNILMEAGKNQFVGNRIIDLDMVERWRREEKIFANRRPELYGPVAKIKTRRPA